MSDQASLLCRFTPGERMWTGGWMSPRAGLDKASKRKNSIFIACAVY